MRDRDLVRLYWPVELRPAFDALLDIDEALGDVFAKATEPALAAIKLAWWRERLEELDESRAPAEPRLRAAADELLPRGVTGGDLAQLEEGWGGLLHDPPEAAFLTEHGARRFRLGARLLDVTFDDATIGLIGGLYVSVAAARRGMLRLDRKSDGPGRVKIGRRARPLTALAALAVRDLHQGGPPFEPEATPGRAWTLFRHRLTGRLA